MKFEERLLLNSVLVILQTAKSLCFCSTKFSSLVSRGDVLPWIVELEMKSMGIVRTFSGNLIALRSVVSCCTCVVPINPSIKTVHRKLVAELETISVTTLYQNTTYQVRFAQQIVAENLCSQLKDGQESVGDAFISIIILEMAFYWLDTFSIPLMPYPNRVHKIYETILSAFEGKGKCWCQTQFYQPASFTAKGRRAKVVVISSPVSFPITKSKSFMQTEIFGLLSEDEMLSVMSIPGSPLICDGVVVGIQTGGAPNRNQLNLTVFIRLDNSFVLINDFRILHQFFSTSDSVRLFQFAVAPFFGTNIQFILNKL